ncbi:MAG: hypothetical protein QNJ63_12205 [Calothrix sp. MO_192.B10]|nr:hypothetical protein [Calothrix sp. MO_192.B10]
MKFTKYLVVSTFLTLIFNALPASSQTVNNCIAEAKKASEPLNKLMALGRAKNVARQAAEAANGGINKYRAEDAMHGLVGQAPCTDNGDGTWTFTFQGTVPGDKTPAFETAVTINSDTFEVKVDRNKDLRTAGGI